jgi:hypothetical protein
MQKDYKTLSKHVVDLDGNGKEVDLDGVERMLRERTRAFSEERVFELYGRAVTRPVWHAIF